MSLTTEALRAVGASAAKARQVLEPLKLACALYDITGPDRLAAFLAQVGHESGGFQHASELWGPTPAQKRYEGRTDLGNTQPGDGSRFRGHGFIQTTGRANHAKVRDRLRERLSVDVPDFEAEPERLAELPWACLSAADYWDMRGLNALADAGDFEAITRKVNGGLNGYADRCARWERVKAVLGAQPAPELLPLHLEQGVLPPVNPFLNDQEPPMAPFLAAALPAVIGAVPELLRMFGSGSPTSERNIKAAEVVVGIAKDAIGARNEQELIETLGADPQAAAVVRQAVQDQWFRIEEVGGGIAAAREVNAKAQGARSPGANPAVWVTAALLPLIYGVVYLVLTGDSEAFSSEVKSMVVAAVVTGVLGGITGYWLGTSASSKAKDDALLKR